MQQLRTTLEDSFPFSHKAALAAREVLPELRSSAIEKSTEFDFEELKKAMDRLLAGMDQMVLEFEAAEYGSKWSEHWKEIQAYGLIFQTEKGGRKTKVFFDEQEVCTADTPVEALEAVPEIIKMLKDVAGVEDQPLPEAKPPEGIYAPL